MTTKAAQVLDLPIARVFPKRGQPRQHFGDDELRLLAASLEQDGQAVPALVRAHPMKPGCYEFVVPHYN